MSLPVRHIFFVQVSLKRLRLVKLKKRLERNGHYPNVCCHVAGSQDNRGLKNGQRGLPRGYIFLKMTGSPTCYFNRLLLITCLQVG